MNYDYLIIGGGTAGCVIAARLAADPNVRVALLEAGPSDANQARVLQARQWMDLLGTELDYDFVIEPQPRGNSSIRHSRGRVLGGCSSHNSCIAFRAPDADLARWEAEGADGWGPADLAPFFERVLATVPVAEPPGHNPLNAALLEAAAQAGIPTVRFARDGSFQAGAGRFQLNIQDGIRQSASVAYLHPLAGRRPNLHIFTDTAVYRILLENGRAVGAETSRGQIRCQRELILCAGAFGSPHLLLLSGIGPAAHLEEMDIPVQVDLPGVGENLQDHPEGVLVWESAQPVPEPISQYWEVGVFVHTGLDGTGLDGAGQDSAPLPDLMLHFGLMPFTWNTLPLGYPTAADGFSLTPNVCRARSRGRVRLRTAHPNDMPRIDFRYFTDAEGYDEAVLLAGAEIARQIVHQPALRGWAKRELAPGPATAEPEALAAYLRRTANTVYHPAGTCKIGRATDPLAVVDAQLRVRGVDGLRVADASVFPSLTTVNPMLTVMAVGEKCAGLLRGEG